MYRAYACYSDNRHLIFHFVQFFKWKSVRRWHKREKQKYDEYIQNVKVVRSNIKADTINCDPGELVDVDVGCVGPMGDLHRYSTADNKEVVDPGNFPSNIYE